LLRHIVTVHRSGERPGQPGDVAPVVVDEALKRGQVHTGRTPWRRAV
jgi:hypothetical protein